MLSKFLGYGRAKLINSWVGILPADHSHILHKNDLKSILKETFTEHQFLKLWFNGIILNLDVIENHNLMIVAFKSTTCKQEVELIFNKHFVWQKLELNFSIPATKNIHLRTLSRNQRECVFSQTQLLDVQKALKNNVTDKETSKVWLGMFIFKMGRLSKENLSLINFGTDELKIVTECGLHSLPKAGDAKVGLLVNCRIPVNRNFLNDLFFNYMDFSARTNTNIVWQKHFNRYEKELLYFIENSDNLIYNILEELSVLEKFKPVFGGYIHENPTNFQILDNLTDVHKGSTKFSAKHASKEIVQSTKRVCDTTLFSGSKPKPFYWVGILPKKLLVKDLVLESFRCKYLQLGRLDKVKNVVVVDPLTIDFQLEVKHFLHSNIIWAQIPEEGFTRLSDLRMVKKQSLTENGASNYLLNLSPVSISTFSRTWVGTFKCSDTFFSELTFEKVLTLFGIKKFIKNSFILELEVFNIEEHKKYKAINMTYKAIKIVMNQSCYFPSLVNHVESSEIDWSAVPDNFAEDCPKLTSVYKSSHLNDYLRAKESNNSRLNPVISSKKSKDGRRRSDESDRIRTLDILEGELEKDRKSKYWILLFDNKTDLSKFIQLESFEMQNLLQTRLCQIENASVFEGMKMSQIVDILHDAPVSGDLPHDDNFGHLSVLYFSFLNPIKLRDMHLIINPTLNWLPLNSDAFQQSGSNFVLSKNLLADWGLFSDLESYILFRLEGKTANFYVKDFWSEGYTMAIPRNMFDVKRFDEELETLEGVVIDDEIQVNLKKSYTVEFTHIPLRKLGRLRSSLFGKTIQEFVLEVIARPIKTQDEIKLWNSQRHVKITAMSV